MRSLRVAGFALVVAGCAMPQEDAPPAPAEASALPSLPALPLASAEPDLSPFERAVGDRMRAVAEVTVEIEQRHGGEVEGHGSGVLISADGLILTADHVVKHPGWIFQVVMPGGETRRAEVIAVDEAHDAALLRAPGPPTPFAPLPSRPRPRGTWVVCAGHGADGDDGRVIARSAGVIAERPFSWTEWEPKRDGLWRTRLVPGRTFSGMIRVDCAMAPGMSGGPVVDLDGTLVGLIVASNGTASPIESVRHLLPAAIAARPRAEDGPRSGANVAPEPAAGADGVPSRAVPFAPIFDALHVGRSLVDLSIPAPFGATQRIPAVIVSTTARADGVTDALAVAPSVRIGAFGKPGAALTPADIPVADHPGAYVAEVVAVRGELGLLRLAGLRAGESDEGAVLPVGPPGVAVAGELVAAVGPGAARPAIGFVATEERRPGRVMPPGPRVFGCGHRASIFREAFPGVTVADAFAHDAGMPAYGSLIVDREGRPLGVEVGSAASGVGFAVPWSEVISRFGEWISPQSSGAGSVAPDM